MENPAGDRLPVAFLQLLVAVDLAARYQQYLSTSPPEAEHLTHPELMRVFLVDALGDAADLGVLLWRSRLGSLHDRPWTFPGLAAAAKHEKGS